MFDSPFGEKRTETTPLVLSKSDDKNAAGIRSAYHNAKRAMLSLLVVFLATLAVSATFPTSSSSFPMMTRMKAHASHAVPLLGRDPAAKLGESSTPTITLSTACSPVEKLSFDPGNWENVGAKLISKSMSRDFSFENGIEMSAVEGKCGQFEVPAADLTVGEEFGFFLYSKTSGNGRPIKDIGCESSMDGSSSCPAHSAPEHATIGGPFSMASCTKKVSAGNLSFYNRVYDGQTLRFTWGSCSDTCGLSEPSSCSSSPTAEEEEVQLTFDLRFSGPNLSASNLGEVKLDSLASSVAEVVGVDASMVEVEVVEPTASTVTVAAASGANLGAGEEGETSAVDLLVTINCIDSSMSDSVTTKLQSLSEEEELKIATESKIEGATSASGHIEGKKILDWDASPPPSPSPPPLPPPSPPPSLTPIPSASWHSFVSQCLAIDPVYGLCTTWDKYSTYGAMPDWDVSEVTDMSGWLNGPRGLHGKTSFNADITKWDTSGLKSMQAMFESTMSFQRDIGIWNTSGVTNMWATFKNSAFNRDISGWDTSSVTAMNAMFRYNTAFNQDISSWTGVAATTAQPNMFQGATAFQAKFSCTNTISGPASSCV